MRLPCGLQPTERGAIDLQNKRLSSINISNYQFILDNLSAIQNAHIFFAEMIHHKDSKIPGPPRPTNCPDEEADDEIPDADSPADVHPDDEGQAEMGDREDNDPDEEGQAELGDGEDNDPDKEGQEKLSEAEDGNPDGEELAEADPDEEELAEAYPDEEGQEELADAEDGGNPAHHAPTKNKIGIQRELLDENCYCIFFAGGVWVLHSTMVMLPMKHIRDMKQMNITDFHLKPFITCRLRNPN